MTTYDDVPYRSPGQLEATPAHLATVAHLYGLVPPDIHTARVLELGCGCARQLLAAATQSPGAEFFGIDASVVQIDEGRRLVELAGLDNVTLYCGDLRELPAPGPFDYIVAHGLWSWVGREVQDAVLELCAERLAPDGLVFLSMNTLPGWHQRRLARDLMRFHVAQFDTVGDRVSEARAILDFVAGQGTGRTLYQQELGKQAELVRTMEDWYLVHDHLAAVNEPELFVEFMARAADAGLAFVADAELPQHLEARLKPKVAHVVGQLSEDRIQREQYVDFLVNRHFRSTVLCRAGREVAPKASVAAAQTLYVAGLGRLEDPGSGVQEGEVVYLTRDGGRFRVSDPQVKALVGLLTARWPATMHFDELCAGIEAETGTAPDRDLIALNVLLAVAWDMALVSVCPWNAVLEPGPAPRALASARALVVAGDERLLSVGHQQLRLGELSRRIVAHADGRPVAELLDAVVEDAEAGRLERYPPGPDLRQRLEARLGQQLYVLCRAGLIVGDGPAEQTR